VDLSPKAPSQGLDRLESWVCVSAFDAADLALLNPRLFRQLTLRQPECLAVLDELAGEPEMSAKGLRLGDGRRAFLAGLLLDLAHEVREAASHRLSQYVV